MKIRHQCISQKVILSSFQRFVFSIIPKTQGYLNVLVHILCCFPRHLQVANVEITCGKKIYYSTLDLRDKYQLDIAVKNKNDIFIPWLISKVLKKNDVFFDIGANCGWYARLVKTFSSKKHKTFSFEPNSEAFSFLIKNNIPDFLPIQLAVSCRANYVMKGKLKLFRQNSGTYFCFSKDDSTKYIVHKSNVSSITVDKFSELINAFPSIIKIDVEGAEYEVICGAKNSLQNVTAILIEVNQSHYENQLLVKKKLNSLLKVNGFNFSYHIDCKNNTITTNTSDELPFGDVLLTKERISMNA